MENKKFGFIGAGNMGGAIARAVAKAVSGENVYLADRDAEKAALLAADIGAKTAGNLDVVRESDFIFFGVKPQIMGEMLNEIKDVLSSRKEGFVLVSMAAGVCIGDIQKMLGGEYPTIRIMPNIPVAVGAGMVMYDCSDGVSGEKEKEFTDAFKFAGVVDRLPEHLIDAGCALSGCGPAFVYQFLEAMADGGVECGLPRDKAMLYAAQTVFGSAKLLLERGEHPGVLKDAVCSPGGSTIAGVHALERGALRGCVMNGVEAAFIRTKELGK